MLHGRTGSRLQRWPGGTPTRRQARRGGPAAVAGAGEGPGLMEVRGRALSRARDSGHLDPDLSSLTARLGTPKLIGCSPLLMAQQERAADTDF